jgi:hypothetical protein
MYGAPTLTMPSPGSIRPRHPIPGGFSRSTGAGGWLATDLPTRATITIAINDTAISERPRSHGSSRVPFAILRTLDSTQLIERSNQMKRHVFKLAFAIPLVVGAQSTPTDPLLKLSFREAIATALGPKGDARLAIAETGVQQAQARLTRAKSFLLPSVDVSAAEQGQARSLDALGLGLVQFPLPGYMFPAAVGPFATFDARLSVSQNFFDGSARKRAEASRSAVEAATAETRVARNEIAAQVALRYLAVLRAAGQEEVNQASVKLAEALLRLAQHRQAAGDATALDISRASAQLSTERQRLMTAESDRAVALLEMLKILGVSMEIQLVLNGHPRIRDGSRSDSPGSSGTSLAESR